MGGGGSPFGQSAAKPSPFEADKARKNREEMSDAAVAPMAVATPTPAVSMNRQPVVEMKSTRPPAIAPQTVISPVSAAFDNGSALAVAPQAVTAGGALDVDAIRRAVLEAMQTGGSQMLVNALEEGHWTSEGNQVSVQVDMSGGMIELSYTREQEKLSNKAASQVAGRTVKVRLVSGAAGTEAKKPRAPRASHAGSASLKAKAAEEPVVKRMMEKFGAEIRIVMDRAER